MSYKIDKYLSFSEQDSVPYQNYVLEKSDSLIEDLFVEIFNGGFSGICFSMYAQGQKPGDIISEEQIRRRLALLKPHVKWVRTFSCTESNELIPQIAKEMGFKTLVGAWLGSDLEKNTEELNGLVKLANVGFVDIAAVGNEVLYRKDLTEKQLEDYLISVKSQLKDVPVGYVDAYYEFELKPFLIDLCDVILVNCYPFWEGTDFNASLSHMNQMFRRTVQVAKGKKVIITETGWPSQGNNIGFAIPSYTNALKYFINAQLWAADNNVDLFYFSSFDEDWKFDAEGEVGGYWGLWDINEKLKFGVESGNRS